MRLILFAGLVLLAACAGPKPCTRTLCVTKLDGTMELAGWTGSVRATADSPKPPVVSDTVVTMIYGTAEMRNGKMKVAAAEGSVFKFTVSTHSLSAIEVLSGSVTISRSSGTIATLAPGTTFYLPRPS